jgi:catechol 2,3-dioxygenase-like lactoylglutathione lyase family enzyme
MSNDKRIHHIGIVVDDLTEAIDFLTGVLGLEVARTLEAPDRGGLKAAFLPCGDAQIELIELSDPEARRDRLGSAQARIEHIAVQVDDVQATFASLGSKGVEFTTAEPETLGPNTFFFTTPESSDGVSYQFLEIAG